MCSKCGTEITERPIIETAEQANQICLDLWYKIIYDIENKKYSKTYLNKYKFNIFDIKTKLVGEYNWQDDCPLCEFYMNCKNCPIVCYELKFNETMTYNQIKSFYKGLQNILVKGDI
jgi:hypothetical protein